MRNSLRKSDFQFDYPEELIATSPSRPSRVLWEDGGSLCERTLQEVLAAIPSGDILVLNETRVMPRRVVARGISPSKQLEAEILFLKEIESDEVDLGNLKKRGGPQWEVLFPARDFRVGEELVLPGDITARLVQKGLPQILEISQELTSSYFESWGDWPLPPYIQKARGKNSLESAEDGEWYQPAWASVLGSLAAPTASLHFSMADLEGLSQRGVKIEKLVLHVGLGTFLPVKTEDLQDHQMHREQVSVPASTWQAVQRARSEGRGIWALGTTVARALESVDRGILQTDTQGGYRGETDLFLYPGKEWTLVNRLLTNFHQPESTLLALVASFTSRERVLTAYQWAIERRFKLFSYGDLTAWIR